jgi:hypothetical protein
LNRTEREDLLRIVRMRERVAKAEANAIAAQRKADFARQLATIYDYDTDDWAAAREAVKRATEQANQLIRGRCQELGIPRPFQPSLSEPYWFDRGENAVSQRRAELTHVADSKIVLEAMPTADQLMPNVTVEEIQNQLAPSKDRLVEPGAVDVRPHGHET